MDIKEFLKSRPLISPLSIERVLNIPNGTIRLTNDRPIPDKYKDQIISLLSIYGWNSSIITVNPIIPIRENIVPISSDSPYYTKKDGKLYAIMYKDGLMNKRKDDVPDGSIVIIK